MQKLLRTIDVEALKQNFRAAAGRRGIDPIRGATSYQAALVQADLRSAATRAAKDYGWWRGRDLEGDARHWETVPVVRVAEEQLDADLVPLDANLIRELWREVRHEVVDRSTLPLRTLHEHQAAWERAISSSAGLHLPV